MALIAVYPRAIPWPLVPWDWALPPGLVSPQALAGLELWAVLGGVGLGLGAMTMMGGVAGLGLYGIAKMLNSGPKESAWDAFSRMEERINEDLAYSMAYSSALIELTFHEDDIQRTFLEYEAEADLARLRRELQQVDPEAWTRADQTAQMLATAEASTGSVTLVKVHGLQHHSADINAIAFHPNQTELLSASSDKTISCLNVITRRRKYCWNSPNSTLTMAVNPLNNSLLSGGEAANLTNWNLDTGQLTEVLHPDPKSRQNNHFIHAVCAGARGKLFASAGADQVVTLWRKHELYNQRYRPLRWLKGHTDTVFSIALSSDERYLASGSADATIRVWDLELMWSEPRILTGHRGAIYAVAVCPTYPLLASAGQDGTLRLWDLPTGQLLKSVQAHSQLKRLTWTGQDA